jgi:hypothetical protein
VGVQSEGVIAEILQSPRGSDIGPRLTAFQGRCIDYSSDCIASYYKMKCTLKNHSLCHCMQCTTNEFVNL